MTRWWLIGAAAFLAVLLIASIVLALTSKEAEFAPGTPEHAVQTCGASQRARTSRLLTRCCRKNFNRNVRSRITWMAAESLSVSATAA